MHFFYFRWQDDIIKPAMRNIFELGPSNKAALKEFFLMITEVQDYDKLVNPADVKLDAIRHTFYFYIFRRGNSLSPMTYLELKLLVLILKPFAQAGDEWVSIRLADVIFWSTILSTDSGEANAK